MQKEEKSLMTRSRTSQLACRLLLVTLVSAVPASSVIAALTASGESLVVSGFETPESVVHDPRQDWYLVSNVGAGNPAALDGNGFISKVSPGGSVLDLTWIQNGVQGVTLNGPKGVALHGEALYVADIDTLRVFDRRTGAPRRNVALPNPFAPKPLFLNDVVVDADGTAYLTDNRNNAIFVVDRSGHPGVLVSGPQLGGPNGILFDRGSLSWVTFFGHQIKRLTRSGQLLTEATLPAADVSALGLPPGAMFLDGYARDEGDLFVTSWVSGKVYRVGRSGTDLVIVASFASMLDNPAHPDGPADIGIDRHRNRLLIPLFNQGQVVIMPLQP
jgi:sugar lactone lactonase YvrE